MANGIHRDNDWRVESLVGFRFAPQGACRYISKRYPLDLVELALLDWRMAWGNSSLYSGA